LRPRASFGKGLSLAARAARAGGACLGLALLVLSGDPAAILGLLAVVGLAIGGVVWTAEAVQPAWVRVLLLVSLLVAARIAAGAAAAALGAGLLALGVLFRIRTKEVTLGLAVFGGIVAAVGGASPKVLLVSWGAASSSWHCGRSQELRGGRRASRRFSNLRRQERSFSILRGDGHRGLSRESTCDRAALARALQI
jgi:hypothetical protein